MFPIEFGVKRSIALDIEVEIWFSGSRVTPYHTYRLPLDVTVRYPRFYQALSLSTQERDNLYLLTPFVLVWVWGMRGLS
jgi:hypothetical protein